MAGASLANYRKDRFRFKGVDGSRIAYGICRKFVIEINGIFSLILRVLIRFAFFQLRGAFILLYMAYVVAIRHQKVITYLDSLFGPKARLQS